VYPGSRLWCLDRRSKVLKTLILEDFQGCMESWKKNAGIAVFVPKGTTSKETVETRSYDKQFFLWANFLNVWVAPRIW
jgi:hypothetical protein